MKIEFVASLLLLVGAVACNDTSSEGSTSTSGGSSTSGGGGGDGGGVTPVGTSTGPVVPGTIGPAGGQISSADGRLTLIVPAGAVSTDVMFGVEPITNQAPDGIGAAYRLTPDGQMFASPATVSFAYTDTDVLGTSAQVLLIAYQDPVTHTWQVDSQPTVDTTAGTVQVPTTHLTDFGLLPGYNMFPKFKLVSVGSTIDFTVGECPVMAGKIGDCTTSNSPTGFTKWSVNGAEGGTNGLGKVVPTDGYHATYTAPGTEPNPPRVAVSAQTPGRGATIVVASVWIAGLTHLDATLNRIGASVCGPGKGDVTEHFSVDINMFKKTISNAKNDPPVITNLKSDLGSMFTVQMTKNPEYFQVIGIVDIQFLSDGTQVIILDGNSVSGGCNVVTSSGQQVVADPGGTIAALTMDIPYNVLSFAKSNMVTEAATTPPDWTVEIFD